MSKDKDYERKVQTSETLIELAMIRLLVARLLVARLRWRTSCGAKQFVRNLQTPPHG
jgi:hypothetical protein